MTDSYVILTISSNITEDPYEEGEIASTGCGLDENIGREFTTMEDLLKYLHNNYGLSENINDYDKGKRELQTTKMVADHGNKQNGGWTEPTEEETKNWKLGKQKLYVEQYFISIREVV